jgi:hypothetical protein
MGIEGSSTHEEATNRRNEGYSFDHEKATDRRQDGNSFCSQAGPTRGGRPPPIQLESADGRIRSELFTNEMTS